MNTLKSILAVLLVALSIGAHAQSWHRTTFHGDPRVLAYNGHALVTCDTTGGLTSQFYSADLGMTWTRAEKGCPDMLSLMVDGSNFFGTSFYSKDGSIWSTAWRSTDDGHTWDSLWTVHGFGYLYPSRNAIAFEYYTGLAISTDGTTWTPFDSAALPRDTSVHDPYQQVAHVACSTDSMLVAMTYLGYNASNRLFISYDLGATWITRDAPGIGSYMVAAYGTGTLVARGLDLSQSPSMYRSTDTGRTWTKLGVYYGVLRSEMNGPPALMVWSSYDTLTLSTDSSKTYQRLDTTGLGMLDISAFTIAGGYIFAARYGDYIYRMPLANARVSLSEPNPPGLYPNPAKDVLHLEGLPSNAEVQIIDALGRTIARFPAAGCATFDASGLPAGTYIVRVGGMSQRIVKE